MTSQQQAIRDALPYLRRYARALLGDQKSADALVLATLQSLASSPTLGRNWVGKRELFAEFTRLLRSPVGEHLANLSKTPSDRVVERRLSQLVTEVREAFLLNSVEGLPHDQIGDILGVSETKVANLIAEARESILGQVSTRVLIIEDEMFIATHLEGLMLDLGHEIMSIERTCEEAIKAIAVEKPGLILADIHLADGSSGIDAVNEILRSCDAPAIFITAYPERLLTGLRPEPTFVISKPFRDETVKAVTSEALFFEAFARSPFGSSREVREVIQAAE